MGLGTGFLIAGTALSAYSRYQASQREAAILEDNAALLKEAARDSLAAGREESRRIRRQGRLRGGQMAAAVGASGVEVGSGSPLQALVEQAVQTDLEARTRMFGARQKAEAQRRRAEQLEEQAEAAEEAGLLGAGAAGLLGAGFALK